MGEDDLASLLANRYPTLPISKRLVNVNALSLHNISILTLVLIFSVKIGIKIMSYKM